MTPPPPHESGEHPAAIPPGVYTLGGTTPPPKLPPWVAAVVALAMGAAGGGGGASWFGNAGLADEVRGMGDKIEALNLEFARFSANATATRDKLLDHEERIRNLERGQ